MTNCLLRAAVRLRRPSRAAWKALNGSLNALTEACVATPPEKAYFLVWTQATRRRGRVAQRTTRTTPKTKMPLVSLMTRPTKTPLLQRAAMIAPAREMRALLQILIRIPLTLTLTLLLETTMAAVLGEPQERFP